MTTSATTRADRISRRQVDKFNARRDELAEAALVTLGERGYARTSLRDIAQHSEFSHGALHYYFADKVDLITHCVRLYKARCVTRYDELVATAQNADELASGFAALMATTMRDDAAMHRLWYDLRSQSMFDEAFRSEARDIDHTLERMVWRVVKRHADLSGRQLELKSSLTYWLFDGLFEHCLLRHLAGDRAAGRALQDGVAVLLARLLLPSADG